jgi:probable rRNA maturation factor
MTSTTRKREIQIQVKNAQKKKKVNREILDNFIEKIKSFFSPFSPFNIGIILLSDAGIQKLNRKFLNKNTATDVLSFKVSKNHADIVISTQAASRNAAFYNNTLEQEIAYLIIHGILHLKGYRDYSDSEKRKMSRKQDEIFNKTIKKNKK